MDHTQIVTASELENYANTRDSETVIPELIWRLITESVPDLTTCRIPYGEAVNQPGLDGLVETETGFQQFVPLKKSVWEIGTGANPQRKATDDISKRNRSMGPKERHNYTYVVVTPRGAGSGGWSQPAQTKWTKRHVQDNWAGLKILDGYQIADWLRDFPAIGKWLLKQMGLVKTMAGFTSPAEHWENLQQLSKQNNDPPLPPKLFLIGRERATAELLRIFRGESYQLALLAENKCDAEDFVAAYLASLDADLGRSFSNRCLFVVDKETWLCVANLK